MSHITRDLPKIRSGRRLTKAQTCEAANPTPSACDIALEGMIVLLARHISREMTSVDQPQETRDGSEDRQDQLDEIPVSGIGEHRRLRR